MIIKQSTTVPANTNTNKRYTEYRQAVANEQKTGKQFLLAIWDTGHVFRSYNDSPEDIAAAVGRSRAWVFERLRLAGDYTRAKLTALIDKHGITTKAELWVIAYGAPTSNERTRRGLFLPPPLFVEADHIGLDIVKELKAFLDEVRLSELRVILAKFFAEHQAGETAKVARPRSKAAVAFKAPK